MVSKYGERFMNNERVSTGNGSLPEFKGRMLSFNGNQGSFGIINAGDDISNAQEVTSISFVVDFTMTRLKYSQGQGQGAIKATSNYLVSGSDSGYALTIDNHIYQGRTKSQIAAQIQFPDYLKQEEIYVGYITNLNGQAQPTALPVWYVSRGVNMWLLGEALTAGGGLTMRTQIVINNNRTQRTNSSGGSNFVLDFGVNQIPDDKAQGFVNWVEAQGIVDWTGTYREEMQRIGDGIGNQTNQGTTPVAHSQGLTEQLNTATQQANANRMQQGNASSPFVGNQQVQQTELNRNEMYGQNGSGLPPVNKQQAPISADPFGNAQEVDINDDDLPF